MRWAVTQNSSTAGRNSTCRSMGDRGLRGEGGGGGGQRPRGEGGREGGRDGEGYWCESGR